MRSRRASPNPARRSKSSDNRGRSVEEAQEVARQVDLLRRGGTFTNRMGETKHLTLDDIMRALSFELSGLIGTIARERDQERLVRA